MELTDVQERVDARGLHRPMLIIKAAQRLRALPPGTLVELLATDPGSATAVTAWSTSAGHELVESSMEARVFRFVLRRR